MGVPAGNLSAYLRPTVWSLWVLALPLSLSCDLVGVGPPPESPSVPRGSWRQHPYQAAQSLGVSGTHQLSTCGDSFLLPAFPGPG